MIDNRLITEFKRPLSVQFKQDIDDEDFGVFSAKPYERGFATTIGNSIRRTLLSSLHGYAIIAFKCDKINNEFQNIEGVYQDTTEILVNLKNVYIVLKDPNVKSRVLHFEINGKKNFYSKDLMIDSNIEVGDPEKLIFSTNTDANFSFDVQVDYGKGYVPSEMFQELIEVSGTIPIDGNYSPILNVTFSVDPVNLGTRSDYEQLTLKIKTKGIISPEEALKKAAQILKESYLTFNNVQTETFTKAIDDKKEVEVDKDNEIFYRSVYSIPFTVRTQFFLKINGIRELGQLVTKQENNIKNKPGSTEEILADIKSKLLEKANLNLDMKNISYVEKNII